MNRRQRFAFRLRSNVDTDWLASLPCRLIPGSHVPTEDHCGKPEHDYCAVCGKTMPGKAERKQQ